MFQIAWSPDGQRLACIAGQWRRPRLWVTDVQTGETHEVQVSNPAVVAIDSVAWLTPGQLLVAGFTVTPKAQGEVAELLVYDSVAETVVEPLKNAGGVALRGVAVSASADGATVAFVTYTDVKKDGYGMPTATERLRLLDRETGVVTELGTGKALFDVNSRRFDDPLISPDGDAVIFRSAGSDVGTSYTVVDAAGTTLMRAKELLYPAGYAWDPTGQKVVFTGHSTNWRGGSSDPTAFYLFDTATGGDAKIIAKYGKAAVQELSWSPDGQTIAFSEYDEVDFETGSIYEFSPSGGDAQLLLHDALFPAFQPAGGAPTP
jgi:Tol biopolymer transport system component